MTVFQLPAGRITTAVYTSPHADPSLDPLPALLAVINSATQTLHFSAYSFTLAPVADAIIAAHTRGVTIRGIADRSQTSGINNQIARLIAAGIDIHLWGGMYALTHEKAVIADWQNKHAAVTLGSYNFSTSAEHSNIEVMLVCTGTQVAKILAPTLVTQIENVYAKGAAVQGKFS